mmetsp:Transcript_7786/g.25782  ORF Transcript_7786/g.25782 Transcript_7786/m.25782 type:complete len:170 (-) Transcript_7786:409-918(-)
MAWGIVEVPRHGGAFVVVKPCTTVVNDRPGSPPRGASSPVLAESAYSRGVHPACARAYAYKGVYMHTICAYAHRQHRSSDDARRSQWSAPSGDSRPARDWPIDVAHRWATRAIEARVGSIARGRDTVDRATIDRSIDRARAGRASDAERHRCAVVSSVAGARTRRWRRR